MLEFDPEDPFPLLGAVSYADEKAHARRVDAWLGLRIEETETRLKSYPGQETWQTKGSDVFLTPYTELRRMLELLQPIGTIVDLGAGYGRLGFVIARQFPGVEFIGYEIVQERVEEGARALASFSPAAKFLHADLTQFTPPPAEYYFLYDYGTREAIAKSLDDLKEIARKQKITVIGRGRAVRDEIERRQPWLTVVEPEHHGNFSFYRSRK